MLKKTLQPLRLCLATVLVAMSGLVMAQTAEPDTPSDQVTNNAEAISSVAASPPEAAFAEHQVVATVQGHASFYASRLQGRRTASGERYDPTALTAAHRSLPFGTWVRVQSLHSGQAIHVRINDRGPFIRGRLIDLSRAAAEALGMVSAGSHAVKVQVLRAP